VSTNAANGQNFNHTYTYDAIGNIMNMTGVGAYLYQGTGKANPHAATSVGGTTYAYDDNGNLTSDGTWTHGWEYDNRLKQSVNGGTTVSYGYDHSGQRVKLVNGSSTTRYANKLYNSDGTKNVKHIYAGTQLIATLENATLQYIHTDHLTGSNVATNNSGTLVQLLDYYPYGSMRIDQTTTFDEQRKFTGHEYDRATSLTYANARYYKQNIGRFISQDPVFLALGSQDAVKLREKLGNPQGLNSYAYSFNNPLKYVDVTGEEAYEFTMKLVSGAVGLASDYLRSKAESLSSSGHQPLSSLLNTVAGGLDTYSTAFDTSASPEARAEAFSSMAGNLYIVTGLIQPINKSGSAVSPRLEPPQLKAGKAAHRMEPVLPGEKPEVTTPSGKRMDRYNPNIYHIREIKPDNPRAIREGQKQVEGYRKEMESATGKPHTSEVSTYDPKKYQGN